jgi:hypothetical protein
LIVIGMAALSSLITSAKYHDSSQRGCLILVHSSVNY